jgi:hypothetical protein
MLRLNLSSKARWIDLGSGVKVECLPITTQLMLSAQADRSAAAVHDLEAVEAAAEQTIGFATAVAKRAIISWSGVGDESGKAVAVTPAGIEALLAVFPLFQAFQREYISPGLSLAQEKNGSAPSLNGTTAAARTTARPARKSAKSAPRAKTPR